MGVSSDILSERETCFEICPSKSRIIVTRASWRNFK